MNDRLVFFVTDRGYVLPTVSAALQVTEQTQIRDLADIRIFLLDIDEDDVQRLQDDFATTGVQFQPLVAAATMLGQEIDFHKTHVPPSTLGKLYASDSIEPRFEHLVYLDGDIWIEKSIYDLVAFDVAPDKLLAATDQMFLRQAYFGGHKRNWMDCLSYTQSIDVDPMDYFNAGVLAARRETWASMAQQAILYFQEHSGVCRYHDQSALNHVGSDRLQRLSPRFNFIGKFEELGLREEVEPAIVHFPGGSKPWLSDASAWSARTTERFDWLAVTYPSLRRFDRLKAAATVPDAKRSLVSRLNTRLQDAMERRRFRRFMRSGFAVK